MQPPSPLPRYNTVAISLHWVIALLILVDFALAISFSQFNPGDALYFRSAYDLHMTVGACILLLVVGRVAWRLLHRPPALPDIGIVLRWLARASHLLLYVFMVTAPLTGWLILSVRRRPTSVFGIFNWSWPFPVIATMPRPERVIWHDFLLPLHIQLSYVGMSLVALHVVAAIYHHVWRHDEVLRRMLAGRSGI